MNQRIIFSSEYDSGIIDVVNDIKLEAFRRLGINVSDSDIGVFDIDGTIFVIGNPVLDTIEYRDEEGNLCKDERRNVTIEYRQPDLVIEQQEDKQLWKYYLEPHLIVYHRFLLAKINDEQVVFG